ncbi:hypothetical protein ACRQ84_12540 [Enterobacter ludwigii]
MMANKGKHWQSMSLFNKASYCFYVAIQLSHNRLVAGSNPAGATKFSDENHAVKPPLRVAFLFEQSAIGDKMAAGFFHALLLQLPIMHDAPPPIAYAP